MNLSTLKMGNSNICNEGNFSVHQHLPPSQKTTTKEHKQTDKQKTKSVYMKSTHKFVKSGKSLLSSRIGISWASRTLGAMTKFIQQYFTRIQHMLRCIYMNTKSEVAKRTVSICIEWTLSSLYMFQKHNRHRFLFRHTAFPNGTRMHKHCYLDSMPQLLYYKKL